MINKPAFNVLKIELEEILINASVNKDTMMIIHNKIAKVILKLKYIYKKYKILFFSYTKNVKINA